jgi:hypothetical protein
LLSSQSSGNETGVAGGGGTDAAVDGTDCGGGDALGVAGTVTLALRLSPPALGSRPMRCRAAEPDLGP